MATDGRSRSRGGETRRRSAVSSRSGDAARGAGTYVRAMDTTAVSDTAADGAAAPPDVRAGEVFLADSRLALLLLNQARYALLGRLFGTSREQANLLTVVLALIVADGAYVTARQVARAPLRISGADAGIGGVLVREGAAGGGGAPPGRGPAFPGAGGGPRVRGGGGAGGGRGGW